MYPTDKMEMTTLLSRSKVRNEDVGFFMFSPSSNSLKSKSLSLSQCEPPSALQ